MVCTEYEWNTKWIWNIDGIPILRYQWKIGYQVPQYDKIGSERGIWIGYEHGIWMGYEHGIWPGYGWNIYIYIIRRDIAGMEYEWHINMVNLW